jgi:hypothetical protein
MFPTHTLTQDKDVEEEGGGKDEEEDHAGDDISVTTVEEVSRLSTRRRGRR